MVEEREKANKQIRVLEAFADSRNSTARWPSMFSACSADAPTALPTVVYQPLFTGCYCLRAVVNSISKDRQWCPNAGLATIPRPRVEPPRKSPRSPSVCGLGAEHRRRQAGLQRDLANRRLLARTVFLPPRDRNRRMPDLVVAICAHSVKHCWARRHPGMARWPETTSGAVRRKAGPEATALAHRGAIKRTAVQIATAWEGNRQDFGGIIFQPF